MLDFLFHRENANVSGVYYYDTIPVPIGAVNQEVDILTALAASGRSSSVGPARYLRILTDVALTVRINGNDLAEIPVDTTDGLVLPLNGMVIARLYFSHVGASSAAGDATVTVMAF